MYILSVTCVVLTKRIHVIMLENVTLTF